MLTSLGLTQSSGTMYGILWPMEPAATTDFSRFTTIGPDQVYAAIHSRPEGLADHEVQSLRQQYGSNKIEAHRVTARDILWRQFKSPFIYLLLGAAVLSYLLGEHFDGTFIVLFVVINAVLGFFQEFRSEQALRLLQGYITSRTMVRRNAKEILLPSAELVPGDIALLNAGDIITADIRLVDTDDVVVDESSLTGESTQVAKHANAMTQAVREPYQALNIVFSGTHVVTGHAAGVVISTGRHTVLGDISRLTIETDRTTSFEQGIAGFSRFILRMILITLSIIFVANVIIKGPEAHMVELLVFSIALAISVIPEALPVVTTLAMSRGALRLAKQKVVVKRLSAIEDLGSIDVLCTDKTGTITENVLAVAGVSAVDSTACFVASVAGVPLEETKTQLTNNAFDRAVWNALTADQRHQASALRLLHILPFEPERRRTTVAVEDAHGSTIIARGAPETIMELCPTLTEPQRQAIGEFIAAAGKAGQRTLAVARKRVSGAVTEDSVENDSGLQWLGVIAFADPLKATAAEAAAQARHLGVQVKIITGDGPEVAGAIGHQIGLIDDPGLVMTGRQIDELTPPALAEAVEQYHVFARLSPRQKFTIIGALRIKHQVGYLGEGINDAPALKAAHVAIVVDSASDIARESADVILLQQHLGVIVQGIQEGREVFANTIKYIKSTLLSNFGNFFAISIASLLIPYLPMLPLQILLVNLLSDFPMISIAADTVDPQEIQGPRKYNVREITTFALLLGMLSTLDDFIFFGIFSRISPSTLQTNWFIGSILTELFILFSIRTPGYFWRAVRPANVLLWLTGLAAVVTICLPYTAFGQRVFQFTAPTLWQFSVTMLLVIGYFIITEVVKVIYYRWARHRADHVTL